jgi:hypothetical protein
MNLERMRFSSKIKKRKELELTESKDRKRWVLKNRNTKSQASVVVLYPLYVLTSLPP